MCMGIILPKEHRRERGEVFDQTCCVSELAEIAGGGYCFNHESQRIKIRREFDVRRIQFRFIGLA